MQLYLRTLNFILLTLLIFGTNSYAEPAVKLCVNDNCKNPVSIEITESCWSDVKEIFSSIFPTDKDEQDNIINSIALIESDIYHSLATQTPEDDTAEELYSNNNIKNHNKNAKKYIGVLLDNHLANRHTLRKTISQSNWLGHEQEVLLLHSLTDSKLYILKLNTRNLESSSAITNYEKNPK